MTRASQNPRGTLCRYPQPLGNAGANAQIVAGGAGIPAPPGRICALGLRWGAPQGERVKWGC